MSTENFINPQFSEEKIRITVLTNICRMLINRGYMNKDKYTKSTNSKSNQKSLANSLESDDIDHDKFLPFIGDRVDNNTYIIPLDKPYPDDREGKKDVKEEFDGSVLVVKLISQVVKDITNSPILNDFFKSYDKNRKIVVFDGMAYKVYTSMRKQKNVEVFDRKSLMIDIMKHDGAPISCSFVTEDDIKHITNPKLPKIHENDPTCRYYGGKTGYIMRIVRPSINNSKEIAYRRVDDPKPVFD